MTSPLAPRRDAGVPFDRFARTDCCGTRVSLEGGVGVEGASAAARDAGSVTTAATEAEADPPRALRLGLMMRAGRGGGS